jgi:hypothetical protein
MATGRLALALLAAAAVCPASAATFTTTVSKENKTIVMLTGEIVEGDAEKLKAIIQSANEAGRLVSGIRFNSLGGNLLEGVRTLRNGMTLWMGHSQFHESKTVANPRLDGNVSPSSRFVLPRYFLREKMERR